MGQIEAKSDSVETFQLPSKVQFGFHSRCSEHMKITDGGRQAEKVDPNMYDAFGVTYGAQPLRETSEFEVEITGYHGKWAGSLSLGVMRCKDFVREIPRYSLDAKDHCFWSVTNIFNWLEGKGPTGTPYGSTNLEDLRVGDRVGMHLSRDGVLVFFVNGKSQGVAARDVHMEGYNVYAVIDHYGNCTATRITRAVISTGAERAERRAQESDSRAQEIERLRAPEVERRAQEAERTQRRVRNVESGAQEAERRAQEADRRVREADRRAQEAERRAQGAEREAQEANRRAQEADGRVRVSELREQEAARRAEAAERRTADLEQECQLLRRRVTNLEQTQSQSEEHPFWVVSKSEIRMTDEEIGRGGWGAIKVAIFRGQRVAAKTLHHQIISPHNIRLFRREMTMAAKVRHPHLLQFIGATIEGEPIILAELMHTSLRNILRTGYLPRNQITSISSDVARALNYLHLMQPKPIIHRDISSANVLLEPFASNTWKAKVSDYGSANFVSKMATAGPGNPMYAAPEAYNPHQQSPKMDVFSFGVLLIEMCTCQLPSVEERQAQIGQIQWPAIVRLLHRCIEQDQAKRPTMANILVEL